jgi:hypothetical protein
MRGTGMQEPNDGPRGEERAEDLEEELDDLDVGADADKVTGGSNDPCEGGQLHRPD